MASHEQKRERTGTGRAIAASGSAEASKTDPFSAPGRKAAPTGRVRDTSSEHGYDTSWHTCRACSGSIPPCSGIMDNRDYC